MSLGPFLTPELRTQIDAFATRLAKFEGKISIGTDTLGKPDTQSLLKLILDIKQHVFDLKMHNLIQAAGLAALLDVVQGLDPTLLAPGSSFHAAIRVAFEANLAQLEELEKAKSPIIQPGTNGRMKGFP